MLNSITIFFRYHSAKGKVHWHLLSCLAAITVLVSVLLQESCHVFILDNNVRQANLPSYGTVQARPIAYSAKVTFSKPVWISKAYFNSIWDTLLDSIFPISLSSFNFEIQRKKLCFIYWSSPFITSFTINFYKISLNLRFLKVIPLKRKEMSDMFAFSC